MSKGLESKFDCKEEHVLLFMEAVVHKVKECGWNTANGFPIGALLYKKYIEKRVVDTSATTSTYRTNLQELDLYMTQASNQEVRQLKT
eukprot:13659009-Ditylum_brightwellii.AAC.1